MVLDGNADAESTVRLRWNEDPPEEEEFWSRSTDFEAIFAPQPQDFIARLSAAAKLRLELHPYARGAVVITFRPRGLATIASKLAAACPSSGLDTTLGRVAVERAQASVRSAPIAAIEKPKGVYDRTQVDKPPTVIAPLSSPRYPDVLRAARVTGTVTVSFVVDTTGAVDLRSVTVVASTHDFFSDAVKQHLQRVRFAPAELKGRRVPQIVRQTFTLTP
jgi:TonB family protein